MDRNSKSTLRLFLTIRPRSVPAGKRVVIVLLLILLSSAALSAQRTTQTIGRNTRIISGAEAEALFRVDRFVAELEPGTVVFDESDAGAFSYRTPLLWIRADVTCLRENLTRGWKIGFVQVLSANLIVHRYETGTNGWDQPLLPVSDSNGTEYPWYDGSHGYAYGYGQANLAMNDNFQPRVAWSLTRTNGEDLNSRLVAIERFQDFRVWIMAYDATADTLYVLGELDWSVRLRIGFDHRRPVGARASLVEWSLVHGFPDRVGLPRIEWLLAPTANGNQRFAYPDGTWAAPTGD